VILGAAMVGAGIGHLTFLREEFQNQVPPWVPISEDLTVLLSGAAEITLGAALLAFWKQPRRALAGAALAAFYVAIFPGNIAQYTEHRDAFGLDTDAKRFARLFFQPVLIAWALWATDAPRVWRSR
jgi:uncharacterized membrane protein